jgi:hypothetical protein
LQQLPGQTPEFLVDSNFHRARQPKRNLARHAAMRDARGMAPRDPLPIPGDLRARLEVARLDLLALFRALDRMDLSPW